MPELTLAAKNRAPLAALVAANLVPLAGVLWLGWKAAAVVQFYWMENLVIGFYAVLKLAFSEQVKGPEKLFTVPFFCVHYGAFCAGHGLFLQIIFAGGDWSAVARATLGSPTWPFDLFTGKLLATVVAMAWNGAPPGIALAITFLAVSHGVSFAWHYLLGGEKATQSVKDLMIAPYNRIFVLHVAIIAGGMAAMLMGDSILLLVILIALKVAIDVWSHLRSHRVASNPVQEGQEVSNV